MSIIVCPKCKCQIELRASFASGPKTGGSPEADVSDVEELLDAINPSTLDDRALEFYETTKTRYQKYGGQIRMTEKQMGFLRKLAEKTF